MRQDTPQEPSSDKSTTPLLDTALWWWSQGVRATGHVHEGQRVLAVRKGFGWQYPVEQLRQATRDAIDAAVSTPRWAGQIAALLLGDQASISHDDWDVFRITGIAHLMSISGLHITLWASLAGGFIAWVGTYDDIRHGKPGQYRVALLKTYKDGFYPGIHLLPDDTIVATTYANLTPQENPSIISVRFKISEVDVLATQPTK